MTLCLTVFRKDKNFLLFASRTYNRNVVNQLEDAKLSVGRGGTTQALLRGNTIADSHPTSGRRKFYYGLKLRVPNVDYSSLMF
jgi:hypothetical protein